jgi:hypothetical protein
MVIWILVLPKCQVDNYSSLAKKSLVPDTQISPPQLNPTITINKISTKNLPMPTSNFLPTKTLTIRVDDGFGVIPTKQPIQSSPSVVPTLSEERISELIKDMLASSEDCKLPCWNNFIPGITTKRRIFEYFSTLQKSINLNISDASENDIYMNIIIPKDMFSLGMDFKFDNNILKIIKLGAQISKGDHIITNNPIYYMYMNNYTLSEILTNYGKPGEVIVTSVYDSLGGSIADYEIVLYYPGEGIMVSYRGLRIETDVSYRLCPKESFVRLWLRSQNNEMTIHDLYLYDLLEFNKPVLEWYFNSFKPLNEATGIDIEEFYNTFLDRNSQACLETSKYLWEQY